MKTITEFLSTKVAKPSTIKATNETIHNIVIDEIKRLGNDCDLNHIDVSGVTNLYHDHYALFEHTDFCGDVSKWQVGNCECFTGVFYDCPNFNCDLSSWDMSQAKIIASMFRGCSEFNQDIGNWNFTQLTNTFKTFYYCKSFNQDLSNWDMTKVKEAPSMFGYCKNFKQDLSSWEFSEGAAIDEMFNNSLMRTCYDYMPKKVKAWYDMFGDKH